MIENFISEYEYYKDASLKKHNTYRIDAACNYLIYPKDTNELISLINRLKEYDIKYIILGNGSNVILAKPVYDVVIKLDRLNNITIKDNIVEAEAGVSLIYLSSICMKNGLDLSFAGGIPGQVGASTAMNAGAYKEDLGMYVKEVEVITPELEVKTLSHDELEFNYRDSFLKRNKDYICIKTTFEFKPLNKEEIKRKMEDRRSRRIATQPLDMPSAGSVFRNPEGMSAGKLIEDIGLKGFVHGGAKISEKHANFIVNERYATAFDIVSLIDYVKDRVKIEYNIDLILEQEIVR